MKGKYIVRSNVLLQHKTDETCWQNKNNKTLKSSEKTAGEEVEKWIKRDNMKMKCSLCLV